MEMNNHTGRKMCTIRIIIAIGVISAILGTVVTAITPYYGAMPTITRLSLTAGLYFVYGIAAGIVLRLIVSGYHRWKKSKNS